MKGLFIRILMTIELITIVGFVCYFLITSIQFTNLFVILSLIFVLIVFILTCWNVVLKIWKDECI